MDEHVGVKALRRTAFYNDWLRGMGDDSIHSLAIATSTPTGAGVIGLLRGSSRDNEFTRDEATLLGDMWPHLSRVLELRGRLDGLARHKRFIESAFDAAGFSMIAVNPHCHIVTANAGGYALLARGSLRTRQNGNVLVPCSSLGRAISAATMVSGPTATSELALFNDASRCPVNVVPFKGEYGRRVALLLFKEAPKRNARAESLRTMYGLTPAETEVALLIAEGQAPATVAEQRGKSLDTVRSQIRSIKSKTGCRRHVELAALINKLPL
jgi:DNA-binding CsgD family transcriptional regulator